jgi:hypothetical protein
VIVWVLRGCIGRHWPVPAGYDCDMLTERNVATLRSEQWSCHVKNGHGPIDGFRCSRAIPAASIGPVRLSEPNRCFISHRTQLREQGYISAMTTSNRKAPAGATEPVPKQEDNDGENAALERFSSEEEAASTPLITSSRAHRG